MPVSFNGFGPVAILIMLACLFGKQVYDYWKSRRQKNQIPGKQFSRKT
jgi:hypothetical protein